MWSRYGNLLEVVDGNWMLHGSRQNHKVLEETRPLDPGMHCPPVCGYALVSANLLPSYGLNSSTVLWMTRETPLSNLRCLAAYPFMGKASGENPEDKSSLGSVKSPLCFQERSYTRS
jgi:hypothetical protein